MTLAKVTGVVFALYLIFGQRYTMGAATGGRGAVSPLEIGFVVLAMLLWIRMKTRAFERVARGIWAPTVGPLFFLLVALPVAGVMVGGYELRTLYRFIIVLVPLSILVLGLAMRRYGVDLRWAAFAAVLAHGLYGLGQLLSRLGVLPAVMWGWAQRWDIDSQAAYSETYVLVSRSTGLFLNPNEFGMWSVLAVLFGAICLRRSQRAVTILLGVLGILGSQSRTAWACLALIAVVYALTAAAMPRVAKKAVAAVAAASPVVVVLALLGVFPRLVESNSVDRLASGLGVFSGGVSADENLEGRYLGWARAHAVAQEYVFGTLGPPQIKLGGSIDNQYVSLYLQGGVILVLAYAAALAAPCLLVRRRLPNAWGLALMSGALAVFSYTATPLDSPSGSALLWVTTALSLAEAARRAKAGPEEESPGSGSAASGDEALERVEPRTGVR